MKQIPLTRGKFALVDNEDFESISKYKWYAAVNRNTFYAQRSICVDGKRSTIAMHRVLFGVQSEGMNIDHKDGDGLNNRRSNIRICTVKENSFNRSKQVNNSSGLKGVSAPYARAFYANKYRAKITIGGKSRHLGYFPTAELAHAAYCVAAKQLHGEFSRF